LQVKTESWYAVLEGSGGQGIVPGTGIHVAAVKSQREAAEVARVEFVAWRGALTGQIRARADLQGYTVRNFSSTGILSGAPDQKVCGGAAKKKKKRAKKAMKAFNTEMEAAAAFIKAHKAEWLANLA
jgi:hypothetical protein